MASASSSSGFEPKSARKYDVFISFRGEDTRNNFTSHLHHALKDASLEVFRDDERLEKGDEIAPSLIQAIKDSSVSLIVFSQDYASSKWCLDELAQIMQYKKEEGQFVIPIFYKVEPSHVRNQTGDYGKAFEKHEIDFKHDPNRVNGWRFALSDAGKLSGRHCKSLTDESKFVQEIVSDVKTKLERIYDCQCALKDVIGIDKMIEPIEELLDKSHKIGIWGMGGAGKTTMAKVVFARLLDRYDTHCFLENIREETERNGLKCVRKSLVSELLGQDMESDAFLSRRLGSKKALVVLDDVDSFKQLEELHDNICNYLKEGSRVIITTRDQQLLRARGYEIHEAKGLNYDNSRQLFIYNAFRSGHPEDGYQGLIEGFVCYTKHNPLALKVLGSLVCSEPKKAWDGLLRKLRGGNPNGKIQNALRLSYDGLDDIDKRIFLDIACFFKGESKEFVEELLERFDFYPTSGMQKLINRALISVTTSGTIEMHDLIQEMGHCIVREENIREPGKRSRLWDSNEICNVLKNHEGEKVEGIMFNPYFLEIDECLELTAKTFNNMKKLRFIKIHTPFSWDYDCYATSKISLPKGGLESISSKIRYFHWQSYPGKSLPSNFWGELLELNLEGSLVETLWEGVQDLANLRRLNLRRCRKLRELPNFSKACRLESVDLFGCDSLRCVHESLLCLHSLISLDVSCCTSLKSLQSRIHLKSLKQVNVSCCFKLKEFSVSSEELTSLDLSTTKIEELRPSMGRCSKLRILHLPNDTKLKSLPILTSLEELSISITCISDVKKNDNERLHVLFDHLHRAQSRTACPMKICIFDVKNNDNEELQVLFDHLHPVQSLHLRWRNLKELPDNITKLSWLEELHLDGCESLTKLPDNMRHLSRLQLLSVAKCYRLQSLPELPPSLRILDACCCFWLGRVSISSTPENCGESVFSFVDCYNLDVDTMEEQAMRLLQNAVHEKEDVTIIYSGEEVPKWFGDNKTQHRSDTVELSLSSHNLLGFVFCTVVDKSYNCERDPFVKVEVGEMIRDIAFPQELIFQTQDFDLRKGRHYYLDANVILSSRPELSKSILEIIEGRRRNHEAITCNPNVFFKFHPDRIDFSGVYPVYASESSDLNFHSRKRKAI